MRGRWQQSHRFSSTTQAHGLRLLSLKPAPRPKQLRSGSVAPHSARPAPRTGAHLAPPGGKPVSSARPGSRKAPSRWVGRWMGLQLRSARLAFASPRPAAGHSRGAARPPSPSNVLHAQPPQPTSPPRGASWDSPRDPPPRPPEGGRHVEAWVSSRRGAVAGWVIR